MIYRAFKSFGSLIQTFQIAIFICVFDVILHTECFMILRSLLATFRQERLAADILKLVYN